MTADFPIRTRLIHEAWSRLLEEAGVLEEFAEVTKGLCDGVLIGVEGFALSSTFIPPNHFKTEAETQIVTSKFADEIALGRISPGFQPDVLESLIGPFRTTPMAVVEQKKGKFRIVINHSFPRTPFPDDLAAAIDASNPAIVTIDPTNVSINSLIDSDDYPCDWGTFSECYLLVADAPEGQ